MYNIRNGRNRVLESALHGMSQANMDLGVFQETKLTKRIYMCESSGYRVAATEAPSAHSGGIAVFYRASEHLSLEALQTYGDNVFRFHLKSGNRRWFILGCYLAPDNTLNVEDIVATISKWPRGQCCW